MSVWLLWWVRGEYEADDLMGLFHTEAAAINEARRLKIGKRERSIYSLLVQGRPGRPAQPSNVSGQGKEKQ